MSSGEVAAIAVAHGVTSRAYETALATYYGQRHWSN